MAHGFVSLDGCSVLEERERAVLVYYEDANEDAWIPKSVIHDDSDVQGGTDKGTLMLKSWKAAELGWEE